MTPMHKYRLGTHQSSLITNPYRRDFMRRAALAGGASVLAASGVGSAFAARTVHMPFANGARPLERFPQKGEMLVLRTRGPLLETPFSVFNHGVFTPNDRFFVRWHYADIPTSIDVKTFRLRIHGHVRKPLELSLNEIIRNFRPMEIAAVNQCSGNSRGFFDPRVAGGEWGNGAMGCARWTGVPLSALLQKAGIGRGAIQVRFNGMDKPTLAASPDFMKSLALDHTMDGEVMVAYAMNGQPLPMLNGFPIRLVVPGWYATYWVKALNDIEVRTTPDTNFWMKIAYTIPDNPAANMKPGETGVKLVPINRLIPRSFVTNLQNGAHLAAGHAITVRGIAFGGDAGVAQVLFSQDGGHQWQRARLEHDFGKYAFRRWNARFVPRRGPQTVMVKCVNMQGRAQPMTPNWNPAGFMRNVVEHTHVIGV